MISPDQIKPFLSHPDQDVRALAADYFSDSWSRDPAILPLLLDARERFGDELFLRNLSRARHLVVNDSTLDRLLLELDRADSAKLIEQLGRLIAKASTELLLGRKDIITAHPKLDPEILTAIELRWTYQGWESEALWEELLKDAAARDLDDEEESNETPDRVDRSDQLIEVLADRTVPDSETICRLLSDDEVEGGWLEIYLTALAGRRQIKEAIPRLIQNLKDTEDDLLIEESIEALARIGDLGTIRLLLDSYETGNWTLKFCTATILGHLKFPESESAILELLKSETEPQLRTCLCVSLCELISDQAVEAVRKEIASGSQTAFKETAPLALSVAAILGQELPKVAVQWQREKKRQQEALKKIEADWIKGVDEESVEGELDPNDDDESRADQGITQPIRNEGMRVGRNDPCSCGSGKKYKKCCGANR